MGMPWFKSLAVFSRELLANPRPIGAACPSSPGLAKRVAGMVGSHKDHFVVEIGAGTGAITAALLRHCVAPQRLIAIERSPALVKVLRQRFSGVRIIEGDACDLTGILERSAGIDLRRVTHLVSSLPLRSLPPEHVSKITGEFCRLVSQGSRLVQYTYDLRKGSGEVFSEFSRHDSSVVWLNLPPARVEVFAASPAKATSSKKVFSQKNHSGKFSIGGGAKPVNASPRH